MILLYKLAPGDMVTLEAKYHKCLFAELVAYMEDYYKAIVAPVIKLSDLGQLFKTCLELFDDGWIHTSRLKSRSLSVLPNFRETSQGQDVLLSFRDDFGWRTHKGM